MTIQDFFKAKLADLWSDIESMRKSVLRRTDHESIIRNPVMLRRAIKMQGEFMELSIETMKAAADLTFRTQFFQAVVDEVAAESPDCAQRIMWRLKRLNDEQAASKGEGETP